MYLVETAMQSIKYREPNGWEVYSPLLKSPVRCGNPTDARRIALVLEANSPDSGSFDYTEVNAAIATQRARDLLDRRRRG